MFPIRDRDGAVIGFGARAIGDEMPKYLNSPQTPIFNKSASLYAIEKAHPEIRKERTVVVVEGYMDAIAAHQFGFQNVVASMGTALTDLQVQSIRRYVDRVFLALDADAAGQLATLRAIDALRDSFADEATPQVSARRMIRFERSLGAEIRVVLLSEGKDPDELIRADPANWTQALDGAIPLVKYVLEARLADVEQTPAARAEALREVAVPLLREIRDPAIVSDYVDLTARLLNYKDTEVRAAVQRRNVQRQRDVRPTDRPVARDHEHELIRILVTYPITVAARQGLLYQVDLTNIVDVRNRHVADAIISNEGDVDLALEELPDELRSYVEGIRVGVELRSDMSPGLATNELTQAIQALERVRYEERVRQARVAIDEAKQSGDAEALRDSVQRMTELAARKPRFDPRESPYFRDSRSQVS
jgi:DNA primase